MTIVNRRNAFLGWIVWSVGKREARRRLARTGPRAGGVLGAILAAVGALLLVRRLRQTDDEGV